MTTTRHTEPAAMAIAADDGTRVPRCHRCGTDLERLPASVVYPTDHGTWWSHPVLPGRPMADIPAAGHTATVLHSTRVHLHDGETSEDTTFAAATAAVRAGVPLQLLDVGADPGKVANVFARGSLSVVTMTTGAAERLHPLMSQGIVPLAPATVAGPARYVLAGPYDGEPTCRRLAMMVRGKSVGYDDLADRLPQLLMGP